MPLEQSSWSLLRQRARIYSGRDGVIMRLKSGIWVAAYIRRVQLEGAQAVLRRRGAEEAGAVFIKLSKLDGTAEVLAGRRRRARSDLGAAGADRAFIRSTEDAENASEADAEAYLARQIKFDSDIWISSRSRIASGRNFLDTVVA